MYGAFLDASRFSSNSGMVCRIGNVNVRVQAWAWACKARLDGLGILQYELRPFVDVETSFNEIKQIIIAGNI